MQKNCWKHHSNFLIGMVYFGYHLVNPHVQTVQNMYDMLILDYFLSLIHHPTRELNLMFDVYYRITKALGAIAPSSVVFQKCNSDIGERFKHSLSVQLCLLAHHMNQILFGFWGLMRNNTICKKSSYFHLHFGIRGSEVEFVTPVTAGGSVKFLPAV